ncbi:hypothetical protein NSQ59_04850 [Margalitia sp. FSL K6-0131]|uniref:hypothetical protein n=1 Tax=Margalitia sp. FSL K6-0131 TaxID=2954604 RepID=UPI0030F8DA1C
MLDIEKVKGKIQLLDESDAKSLLLIIYARLDSAINGKGGEEPKQIIKDLLDIYSELPGSRN